MQNDTHVNLLTTVAPRVLDLRAEFEAQLRAVARLEEQLQKTRNGHDEGGRHLEHVLRRELAEMLTNNSNIREVLKHLEAET